MSRGKDYEKMLEDAISEQRRVYDGVESNYIQTKSRTLAFLGAGFAIFTFLFASGDTFFPGQDYGKVFYIASLIGASYGFAMLFIALQPVRWRYPTEKERLLALDFPDRIKYLEYIKKQYILSYSNNISVTENKHKLLRNSFYPLLISATLLILLKIFKETL